MKSIEDLLEEALGSIDDPSTTVASLVRQAIRIATKRQDYLALARLVPETLDMTAGHVDNQALAESRANLAALLGEEEADKQVIAVVMRQMETRKAAGGMVYAQSIAQLEAQLGQINEVLDSYKSPPQNLTPIDTYFMTRSNDAATAKLLPLRHSLMDVIERIRQVVHDFLVETERQLESGQRRPHVFDRGREYIEQALQQAAPAALETFRAAEDALRAGAPEDLAHAPTSCRRMIKALADALYPPTNEVIVGEDGRERRMSDDAYRNRLMQFAVERLGDTTHADLMRETLRSLGTRLQRLNELSSKGVHDQVTSMEAETCVMWTYLTAADFLRIAGAATNAQETGARKGIAL